MDDAKGISTPMGTNGNLDSDASGNMLDQKLYRSMIGSLLYVTASRPDVMFNSFNGAAMVLKSLTNLL